MKTLKEYGYASEKDFIRAAALNPSDRERFKEFVQPLSAKVAHYYIEKYRLHEKEYKRLTKIGMRNFDTAFNLYLKKPNVFDNGASYKFTSYFVYWIEKAIEDEINGK